MKPQTGIFSPALPEAAGEEKEKKGSVKNKTGKDAEEGDIAEGEALWGDRT